MSESCEDIEEKLPDTQGLDSQETCRCTPVDSLSESWGRLFSLNENYNSLDLKNEEYSFGRLSSCDVIYKLDKLGNDMLLLLSKVHFKIRRSVDESSTTRIVELQDFSYNGTFVNGVKVGRGNTCVLQNNDEVALASAENKVYIFINSNPSVRDGVTLPAMITDQYVVSRLLGSGTFGVVHLVFDKENRTKYAMKTIVKDRVKMSFDSVGFTKYNEGRMLENLDHPCIIKVFSEYESPSTVHLMLEFMEGGDLLNRITEIDKFAELEAKFIFYQLVLAVKYLHSKGITHRDLKVDNILLKTSKEYPLVKLADFGLSRVVGDSVMSTFCGTPQYLAPEVLQDRGRRGYTNKVDVWSLGVILYVCLSGKKPFVGDERRNLQDQILQGIYLFPRSDWENVSPQAEAIIKKMIVVNPAQRLNIDEVSTEPWLSSDRKIKKRVCACLNLELKRQPGTSDENMVPNKRLCTDS